MQRETGRRRDRTAAASDDMGLFAPPRVHSTKQRREEEETVLEQAQRLKAREKEEARRTCW